MKSVGTFWHGKTLSALDLACMLSFSHHGFDVHVFSYDPIANLPEAFIARDASEIVPRSYMNRFYVNQHQSIAHFSDYFRYRMFENSGLMWVDTDMLCLTDFKFDPSNIFVARQSEEEINNAVLYIPSKDEALKVLINSTLGMMDRRNVSWGQTGPQLLTRIFSNENSPIVQPSSSFYPIQWQEWYRPFIAREKYSCDELTKNSRGVHLWNKFIDAAGIWKQLAPPEGSYLHSKLKQTGDLSLFKEVIPDSVINTQIDNYRFVFSTQNQPRREAMFNLLRRIAGQRS